MLVRTCEYQVPSSFVDNPEVVASQVHARSRSSYEEETGHDISYRNGVEYDGIEHVSSISPLHGMFMHKIVVVRMT